MDISFAVCVFLFVCLFVRLRISPPRIHLAVSNFARLFIGVLGKESHMLVNFARRRESRCWHRLYSPIFPRSVTLRVLSQTLTLP